MANAKIERGNTNLAVKAGIWYVLSTFLTKGLAFITTPIFARLMTSADYGEFSNYANWQSMLLIIVSAELYNTLSRAYYDFTDEYDQYVSSVTVATCGITAIFYVLFLLCRKWIFNIVSIPPQFVHILFFTMMFQGCKSVYLTRERTLYRYKSVALISVLSLVVPTLISVVLVVNMPESSHLSARIYGFYVPYALLGVYCAAVLLFKGKTFKWAHFKYAIVLAIPLLVHYLTAYILSSGNTIVAKSVLGAQTAAIVSIATSVMNILTMLFQAVTGAMTTWLMDNLQQERIQTVRRGSLVISACAGLVVLGVMLLGPEVVWVLGGAKYAEAVTLIPGLATSIFIQTITTIFTVILTYDKNIAKTAVYTGIVAVVSIALKVLLVAKFGYMALPYVNIAAFAVLFFISYLLVRKAGYGKFVNLKGMVLSIVVILVMMVVCSLLYQNTMVRYGLILVMAIAAAVILWKTKAVWMKLLKKKKLRKKEA